MNKMILVNINGEWLKLIYLIDHPLVNTLLT